MRQYGPLSTILLLFGFNLNTGVKKEFCRTFLRGFFSEMDLGVQIAAVAGNKGQDQEAGVGSLLEVTEGDCFRQLIGAM
jgi:hypothetical protein